MSKGIACQGLCFYKLLRELCINFKNFRFGLGTWETIQAFQREKTTMQFHRLLFTILSIIPILLINAQYDVNTSVGKVSGFIDDSTPYVKQWLGVPYAEPPIQSLRFLPPVAKSKTLKIDGTKLPPSCQQYRSTVPDVFTVVPEFLDPGPFNEDCLYLNVIAPSRIKGKRGLPVLVWIHGGMTLFGGINTPYEKPEKWVQRSQEHVVVQINYRLNIFGFPNAKGLDTNNLGILDQRLALEWVRANIRRFGGDPEQIILWGHSAGAASADAHQFAFKNDPIFKATILESGVAVIAQTGSDLNKTSFQSVAKGVGCNSSSPKDEVDCMRKVDAGIIEDFLQNYTDSGAMPRLYFSASADRKVAFLPQEFVAKGKSGDFANLVLAPPPQAVQSANLATQLAYAHRFQHRRRLLFCPLLL